MTKTITLTKEEHEYIRKTTRPFIVKAMIFFGAFPCVLTLTAAIIFISESRSGLLSAKISAESLIAGIFCLALTIFLMYLYFLSKDNVLRQAKPMSSLYKKIKK